MERAELNLQMEFAVGSYGEYGNQSAVLETKYNPYKNFSYTLEEDKLDLNSHFIKNPSDTFLIRVQGDSMIKAGITPGNILIVDRRIKPRDNKIVVAAVNDGLVVKRLKITPEEVLLVSENDKYMPIKVKRTDKFEIWGVVTSVIKAV